MENVIAPEQLTMVGLVVAFGYALVEVVKALVSWLKKTTIPGASDTKASTGEQLARMELQRIANKKQDKIAIGIDNMASLLRDMQKTLERIEKNLR